MMAAHRPDRDEPGAFVERVEKATQERFAGRPVYAIGDVLQPLVPVVEGVWSSNGRTIIEVSGDSADPAVPLVNEAYQIDAPDRTWYVAFLAPVAASAERARRFMGRRGIQAYWPRAVVAIVRGRGPKRRMVQEVRPVFPGYVLAHVPKAASPKDHLKCDEARFHGISDLVEFAETPVTIPSALVERIVERERNGEFDSTSRKRGKVVPKLPDWLFEGAIVMVVGGPFKSFPGTVEAIDEPHARLKVAIAIFGRATPVELGLAEVRQLG